MTEGALTVSWPIVVWSMHLFVPGGAALWLQLQVSCAMGLLEATCFCLWDLSNCSVLVPGLGYFLAGMMLLFVSVAHVLC